MNLRNYARPDALPVRALRRFWDSPLYLALVVAVVTVGNLFGLDMVTFAFYAVSAVLIAAFAEDTKPSIILWVCGYITVSRGNNPAYFVEGEASPSLFYQPGQRALFIGIVIVVAISVVVMIVKGARRLKFRFGRMTVGILLLGVFYMLGGIGSEFFGVRTVLFGALEILTVAFPYFFLLHTVDPKSVTSEDYGRIFSAVGVVLIFETLNMYRFVDVSDFISRGLLFTGWGMYNNVANMLLFCIPAPFLLMRRSKKILPYGILSVLFLGTTFLTQSRNGMAIGSVVFLASLVAAFVFSKEKERKKMLFLYIPVFIAAGAFLLTQGDLMYTLFNSLSRGESGELRMKIYRTGIEHFTEHPLFGNGFYRADFYRWGHLAEGSFLPPRYHNIYVQLLATGGILALGAYVLHRFQTVVAFLRSDKRRTFFLMLSILSLPLSSLLDNFFFNIGPGLTYSVLLFLLECDTIRTVNT